MQNQLTTYGKYLVIVQSLLGFLRSLNFPFFLETDRAPRVARPEASHPYGYANEGSYEGAQAQASAQQIIEKFAVSFQFKIVSNIIHDY